MRKSLLYMSVALALVPGATSAQTSLPGTQTTTITEEDAAKKIREDLFAVATKERTKIFEDRAVPMSLVFKKLSTLSENVSVEGVTAEGYMRYVTVNGRKIGQAVISKLRKADKSVDLDAQTFTSQFDLKINESELAPEKVIDVDGNEAELVAALKQLNSELAEEEEEEDGQRPRPDQNTTGSNNRNAASAAQGGGSNGDMANQPQDSGYKTPERSQAEPEPTIEVRTTTQGCDLVVDAASNVVREQSKAQTFKDGIMVEETACLDSGKTFPIKKSYLTCGDTVDIAGRRAQPQYISYFDDASGVRQELSDCQPDPEQVFEIVEAETCPISIDLIAGVATVNTKLVYTGNNNKQTQVRDCMASETLDPIPMEQDFAACSIKHDFPAGKSTALATWIYQKDGNYFQASPCIETKQTYNHQKVYKQGGVDVCPVLLNVGSQYATPQYRTKIDIGGEALFIDECKPDVSGNIAFKATPDTCENPENFQHDLAAGVSYGLQRYYYNNPDRIYVTDCEYGGPTYQHAVRPTGWKHNDEALSSQALSTVSIVVKGSRYVIAEDVLLGGEPSVPYAKSAPEDVPLQGSKTHEGCNVYQQTEQKQYFTRPDQTIYEVIWGKGVAQDLGDMCERTKDGWVHNDPELFSQQATTVTVKYDGIEAVIEQGVVEESEPKIDYVPDGSQFEIIKTGQKQDKGCEVFTVTENRQKYLRGDQSIYELALGDGEGVPLGDKCVRERTGWEHNDEENFSLPMTTATLKYDDVVKVIHDNVVLPDAEPVPHEAQDVVHTAIEGKYTNEGCNVFQITGKSQKYLRPDETEYTVELGDGDKIDLGDKCTTVATGWLHDDDQRKSWRKRTQTISFDGFTKTLFENEVLPGEQFVQYEAVGGNIDVPDETVFRNDVCEVYQGTNRQRVYERPDNSIYVRQMGEGEWKALGDKCVKTSAGWKHDDADKRSTELMTVRVQHASIDKTLFNNEVTPWSKQVLYIRAGFEDKPVSDGFTNEGCNVFQATNREQSFRRADNTIFKEIQGNGERIAFGDKCVKTVVGYDHDDSNKQSTERMTVRVQHASYSKMLFANEVTQWSKTIPYSLTNTVTVENNAAKTYDGCKEYVATRIENTWTRSGGSTLKITTNGGNKLKRQNACVRQNGDSRRVVLRTEQRSGSRAIDICTNATWNYDRTYYELRRTYYMVNPLGAQISTHNETIPGVEDGSKYNYRERFRHTQSCLEM